MAGCRWGTPRISCDVSGIAEHMLVVDASVLAAALADDGSDGAMARARLHGEKLAGPTLVDLEVTSVLCGRVRGGHLTAHRAGLALADLKALPMQRVPHTALLDRIWELRDNLTVYDAAYVALAEILGAPLVTADRKLAGATGPACRVETLG